MLKKRLTNVNKNDISKIIEEQVKESSEVEFKEDLPARKGDLDPWIKGENKIGDRARNEILEEVIAFANAYGGTFIIGIKETPDKPARASKITTIPKCVELADRLRLQCRDCIEPKIPQLEIAGIPIEPDGSGVVVLRVPQSRMAPHRHTITKECYIRRADRSEKMTMREIQDLTLQVERGIALVEKKLTERGNKFEQDFEAWTKKYSRVIGIRLTLYPLTPISIAYIYNEEAAHPILESFKGVIDEKHSFNLSIPIRQYQNYQQRPILRGLRKECGSNDFKIFQEVYSDGLIEYSVYISYGSSEYYTICPDWIVCLLANTLCSAEKLRNAASAPSVEYGLEFEIVVPGDEVSIAPYGGSQFGRYLGPFPSGKTLFPKYSIGELRQYQEILNLFMQDFWNASGHNPKSIIQLDWETAFSKIGID
ncbi:MAG: ATP-binding protein [Cyanobacteria bacterium J06635_15]